RAGAIDASAGWQPLFAGTGAGLVEGLDKFLYGRRQKTGNLAASEKGIWFTPTHMTDHLATPFLEVARGAERWTRVVHEWSAPSDGVEPLSCVVVVQDERCFELAPDRTEIERGERLTVTQYLRIPANIEKVRVRLTLPGMAEARLPDRLSIEELRQSPLV